MQAKPLEIVVGSLNPVKKNSTSLGFQGTFPDIPFTVFGVQAESLVSFQPMTEEETLLGASNRCLHSKILAPHADFWFGIEGGVKRFENVFEAFAWVCALSKEGRVGKGRTGSFILPEKISQLVLAGMELGDADDLIFGKTNSKQDNGLVGALTNNFITRTSFYMPAVAFALIPFKNPDLY